MISKKSVLPTLLGAAIGLTGFLAWVFLSPIVQGDSGRHELTIKSGTAFSQIVAQMRNAGIVADDIRLPLAARLLRLENSLKAGRYQLDSGLASYSLLQVLASGRVVTERHTIPEGLQARQIAGRLARSLEIDSTAFVALVQDEAFARELGIPAPSLEGFLFPETYTFQWGTTARQAIKTMVGEFKRQFNDSLQTLVRQRGHELLDVVTLASIIEGEAVVDQERDTISAVYHNRLRKGMLLQADPTIQYVVPDGPRRLLNKDLEIDSPYNTYKYTGLPPGPINSPGLASLLASINPAKVDYIYFVAAGDGSHNFSRTLREHLRAKAAFDRVRRNHRKAQTNKKD